MCALSADANMANRNTTPTLPAAVTEAAAASASTVERFPAK
jgi:hypothetical protein